MNHIIFPFRFYCKDMSMTRTKMKEEEKKAKITVTISPNNADYLSVFKNKSLAVDKIFDLFREQNPDFLEHYLTGEVYL